MVDEAFKSGAEEEANPGALHDFVDGEGIENLKAQLRKLIDDVQVGQTHLKVTS